VLPTDLNGKPLENVQPSIGFAVITEGIVTAYWVPEYAGTYAITEHGINVRLAEGQKLKFGGLQIFVLPNMDEAQ
jgi:hypothetical protein